MEWSQQLSSLENLLRILALKLSSAVLRRVTTSPLECANLDDVDLGLLISASAGATPPAQGVGQGG